MLSEEISSPRRTAAFRLGVSIRSAALPLLAFHRRYRRRLKHLRSSRTRILRAMRYSNRLERGSGPETLIGVSIATRETSRRFVLRSRELCRFFRPFPVTRRCSVARIRHCRATIKRKFDRIVEADRPDDLSHATTRGTRPVAFVSGETRHGNGVRAARTLFRDIQFTTAIGTGSHRRRQNKRQVIPPWTISSPPITTTTTITTDTHQHSYHHRHSAINAIAIIINSPTRPAPTINTSL